MDPWAWLNPFDLQYDSVKVSWPVGSFGDIDVLAKLSLIDDLIEVDDLLGARQHIHALAKVLLATRVLDPDELDDMVLAHGANQIIRDFRRATEL